MQPATCYWSQTNWWLRVLRMNHHAHFFCDPTSAAGYCPMQGWFGRCRSGIWRRRSFGHKVWSSGNGQGFPSWICPFAPFSGPQKRLEQWDLHHWISTGYPVLDKPTFFPHWAARNGCSILVFYCQRTYNTYQYRLNMLTIIEQYINCLLRMG